MGLHDRPCLLAAALLLLTALGARCGGEGGPPSTGLGGLRGKTVGVVTLSDVSTLETRYVLQKGYGLDTSLKGSAVTFVEAPPESLVAELEDGEIDAAVLTQAGAFRLLNDDRFRVVIHVSQELDKLSGGPAASSILLSYSDVAEQKGEALIELNRLLAESVVYYETNRRAVLEAVGAQGSQDPAFLRWQAERQSLPLGDLSTQRRERLARTWQLAAALGDIDRAPDPAKALFAPAKRPANGRLGGSRITVSLALLDDPSRRAAVYAIEQGIASSSGIDVSVTYLAPSALAEAAMTKQYDVVEAQPLAVASSAGRDLGLIVVSAGAEDLDGTLLFVRNEEDAP